jgi:hypothetical protein
MALATPTGAESALLGEAALGQEAAADAALALDPGVADPLSLETGATPAPLPTGAVLDEEAMLEDLLALARSEQPVPAYVAYFTEHVTDGPSYIAFLRASYRSQLVEGLAECPLDVEAGKQLATMLAETFGPFLLALSAETSGVVVPGTAMYVLLSANPGIATNGTALVLGILEGMADSKIASAETVFNLLAANTALTVLLPVHAVCFIAGTIYQLLRNIYDTVMAVVAAVGFVDDVLPLACRLLSAMPVALGRLLDVESADDVALLGKYLGQMLGASLEQYVPQLSTASTYGEIAYELVEFSFNCGTWFGPLLLDILLWFIGVGYFEAAIKLLGKAVSYAPDVLQWIFTLLRRLFDAVDPTLFDDLLGFGATLAGRLASRMDDLAQEAAAAYGFVKESIDNGFKVLEEALGTDRFRSYTGSVFCTLEP